MLKLAAFYANTMNERSNKLSKPMSSSFPPSLLCFTSVCNIFWKPLVVHRVLSLDLFTGATSSRRWFSGRPRVNERFLILHRWWDESALGCTWFGCCS